MEDVTRRTIVYDNYFLQVPAQLVQVLNVITAVVHAGFSEESRTENIPSENEILNLFLLLLLLHLLVQ